MADRLHIVMPCAKPHNLPLITKNLLIDQAPHGFEVRLHIMRQGPEDDPKGYRKCNEGTHYANSGFLWYPSDDTLQALNLFQVLSKVIANNPFAKAIVFSEIRKGVCPYTGGQWPKDEGILYARPENMKRCRVDCTQVFFHHSLNPHFDTDALGPEADGDFISRTYQQQPQNFVFVPDHFVAFGVLDPLS